MNAATLDFIRQHARDDVRQLALRPAPAEVDLRTALIQIEGRQLAAHKLPTWAATDGLLFPPRLALEQCSSEATAQYKRSIIERLLPTRGGEFTDLTAGFGVDFAAIAPLFDHATYVDRQQALCDLARHNLPLLGLPQATVRCSTAEAVLSERPQDTTPTGVRVSMIDPARRDTAGRKVTFIEDCTPDICALQSQLRAAADVTLIKLSPMLDLSAALRSLSGIMEAHVVSVAGECKELLLVMSAHALAREPIIYCACGTSAPPFAFRLSEERDCRADLTDTPGPYLYEPDAALLKAGAFKLLCHRYAVRKLAPDTHLYTSDRLLTDFPGRRWHIADSAPFSKRELRRLLADVPAADLTVRGFPTSVATLRKQLRLREGGDIHLVATTLGTQRLLLRVEKA